MAQQETEIGAWLREEALNVDKMWSGERRLDFMEWKQRRSEPVEPRPKIARGEG